MNSIFWTSYFTSVVITFIGIIIHFTRNSRIIQKIDVFHAAWQIFLPGVNLCIATIIIYDAIEPRLRVYGVRFRKWLHSPLFKSKVKIKGKIVNRVTDYLLAEYYTSELFTSDVSHFYDFDGGIVAIIDTAKKTLTYYEDDGAERTINTDFIKITKS